MVTYFLIPKFARSALSRQQLPLSTFLDFNKMREILSINDIVLINTLQKGSNWAKLLGIGRCSVEQDFWFDSSMSLYDIWYKSATEENKTYLLNILSVLVESGQANDEIAERLFNNSHGSEIGKIEQPYEIVDIGPKYYGIILESGVFPNWDLSNKLIKDILRSMYLYGSQSEIAKTEFFRLYMNRL